MKNYIKTLVLLFVLIQANAFAQINRYEEIVGTVESGDNITLTAGESITFYPDFWIKSGATFHAYIDEEAYYEFTPSDENYTYKMIPKKEVKINDVDNLLSTEKIEGVVYYDNLGRPVQNIGIKQSENGNDIITPYLYDEYGQKSVQYLPYSSSNNRRGELIESNTVLSELGSYYQSNYGESTYLYSEVITESSPLGRPIEQSSIGDGWQIKANETGRTSKAYYEQNGSEGFIRIWSVDSGYNLITNGIYVNGSLKLVINKSPDWESGDDNLNTSHKYTDILGNVVLERNFVKSEDGTTKKLNTYFVYDDFGNLIYVLPPLANGDLSTITEQTINELCYQYKYNNEGQLVESKIPGRTWEYFVYDRAGRLVLVQNELQKLTNEWIATKYDKFGRIIYNGLFYNSKNRIDIQDELLTATNSDITFIDETFYYGDFIESVGGGGSPVTLKLINGQIKFYFNAGFSPTKLKTGKLFQLNISGSVVHDLYLGDLTDGEFAYYVKIEDNWLSVYNYGGENNKQLVHSINKTLVANFNSFGGSIYETKDNTKFISYTNNVFPEIEDNNILSVAYYDDYNFTDNDKTTPPSTVYGEAISNKTKGLATASWTRVLDGVNNMWIKSYIYYDNKGRAIYAKTNNWKGGYDIVETKYNYPGELLESKSIHRPINDASREIVIVDKFEYSDYTSRLTKQTQSINGGVENTIAEYTYSDMGDLTSKKVGGGLQEINYRYNIKGSLTHINDPDDLGDKDLFAIKINYQTTETGLLKGNGSYNGGISEVIWRSKNDDIKRAYAYAYDDVNRLKEAKFDFDLSSNPSDFTPSFDLSNVTYDNGGNIKSLNRSGKYLKRPSDFGTPTTEYGTVDLLQYSYSDNKLVDVVDNGKNQNEYNAKLGATVWDHSGFTYNVHEGNDYEYDINGNLTKDLNKGITSISYNHMSLPTLVVSDGGTIKFTYDAAGNKLSKTIKEDNQPDRTVEYINGFVYSNNTFSYFPTSEGYVYKDVTGYKNVYQYADHLGNVRLSYTDANNDNEITTDEIIQESNYYPFGLKHTGYNSVVASNGSEEAKKLGFNGKEYEQSIGLNAYEFGSRIYDPAIARWMSIDPQAERTFGISPYAAMNNNPVMFIDPNGEFAWVPFLIYTAVSVGVDAASGNIENWEDFGVSVLKGAASAYLGGAGSMTTMATGTTTAIGASSTTIWGTSQIASHTAVEAGAMALTSKMPGFDIPINDNLSVNVSPAMAFGTGGPALGVSGGVSYRNGDVSLSFGGSYGSNISNFGGGISLYDRGNDQTFSLGGSYFGGSDSQKNWLIGYNKRDFSFRMTNDVKVGGDKYRTAAAEVGIGEFNVGFNLYTTPPPKGEYDAHMGDNREYVSKMWGESAKNKDDISYGTYSKGSRVFAGAYLGYRNNRIGFDGGSVQDATQNFVHRHLVGTPYFNTNLGSSNGIFRQVYRNLNKWTLYSR